MGLPPGPALRRVLAGANGNPLLVDEALRTLAAESALRVSDHGVDVDEGEPLPPLRLGVLRRSSLVDDDAIAVLRTAAVLGARFRVQHLALLTGRPVRDLAEPLIALSRAGLVDDDGEFLAFRHDLVHDALYRDIPEAVRLALHHDAAIRLHEAGVARGGARPPPGGGRRE